MDKFYLLKFLLIIEVTFLLGQALAISKDYQDSWVLEGLEIPFLLFVTTYALVFFLEKSVPWTVALAVAGRCMFLLIPNIKYIWFQGTAVDQHVQYGLANHVYNEGHIATQGPSGVAYYVTTPSIHLNMAIFSIVLDIPVVDSVKYLPIFLSAIYPLFTYVMMKRLKLSDRTAALRYALFFSSVPTSPRDYIVAGALFGVLLAFLILTSLVTLLLENDRSHWFIFMFFSIALATTHSSSSVLLTTFLLAIMLFQKLTYFRLKSYLRVPAILAVTLICVVWLSFPAMITLEAIVRVIFVGALKGATPGGGYIPSRFFELARIDVLAAIESTVVLRGMDIFLLLLTLGGLMVLMKARKRVDDTSKLLFLVCGIMLLFIPFGLLMKVGGFRVLHLASPLFPIFASIFVLHIAKGKMWLPAVTFSLAIFLATLQLYSFQPLIPSANVLSKDLPRGEPILYVTAVNSIYQRQMIEFAEDYVKGQIASDRITRNQIIGLTAYDFSSAYLAWYYPLDRNQPAKTYDYFLIHLPGPSGALAEQAEIRTRNSILEVIYSSSILYTNGESYILDNRTARYP